MPTDFKTIPHYPNYSVAIDGRVRNDKKGNLLRWVDNGKGYQVVKLYNEQRPQGRLCLVHRLVLSTHDPRPGEALDVNHIDGNKRNNHISNLEWVTKSENTIHAHKTGLFKHLLSDDQVLEIRAHASARRYSHRQLAAMYGVSRSLIQQIVYRRSYDYL